MGRSRRVYSCSETEVTFPKELLEYSSFGMFRSLSIGNSRRIGESALFAGARRARGDVRLVYGVGFMGARITVHRTRRGRVAGITLVELLVAVAMLVAISAVAIPSYQNYMNDVRINNVRKDFVLIEAHIERFRTENGGSLPDALNETAATNLTDPWGNPYRYLNIEDAAGPGLGKVRKDKNLVPLNTDFDLYSMGKDGKSKPPLTAAASHDDVVRANNGAYVGLASEY